MPRKKHPKVENVVKQIEQHPERHQILHHLTRTLHFDFKIKDLLQIIVGAALLAIPVGFTQEVWDLGNRLSWENIVALIGISFLFISMFVYYSYYKGHMAEQWDEFVKRVCATYIVSLLVVASMLTILEVTNWTTHPGVSLKIIAIVTYPASLSAAVADILK